MLGSLRPFFQRPILLFAMVGLALAALLIPWDIDAPGHWYHVWNLGHVVLFALVSAGLHFTLAERWKWAALPLALGFAFATEVAQQLTGRDGSYADLGNNMLGVAIGWYFCSGFRQRVLRWPALAAILFGAALSLTPIARILWARITLADSFPVLFDPAHPRARHLWDQTEGMTMEFRDPREDAGGIQLAFYGSEKCRWPAATLRHPVRDWSAFEVLSFSARAIEVEEAKLGIRFETGSGEPRSHSVTVGADWQPFRIPLPQAIVADVRAVAFLIDAHRWEASRFQLRGIRLE